MLPLAMAVATFPAACGLDADSQLMKRAERPSRYERASPLTLLAGSWIAYDENLNPQVTFTIAGDGSFIGQNMLGCNSMGQFAIIDPDFNLYEVQSTIADCALAGEYVGLAFLGDLLAPNDVLVLANDNGSRAFLTGFER